MTKGDKPVTKYTSRVPKKSFTAQTESVSRVHLLLQQGQRPVSGRSRHAEIFSGESTVGAPDDHHLEANGFIERASGQGRSIQLLLERKDLPDLE
jgi:hypothetical protein